jgi:hypothetical protein
MMLQDREKGVNGKLTGEQWGGGLWDEGPMGRTMDD